MARAEDGIETLADIAADLRDPYMGRGDSVRNALRRCADRIDAAAARQEAPPPAIEGRGYRRVQVSVRFIELLVTQGIGLARPKNVPEDFTIHAARWNGGNRMIGDTIELLASSMAWTVDGQGWESAIFLAEFRRMPLWIVGRALTEPGTWEFQGVFKSELEAAAACRDETYFIGSAELGVALPHETVP